MKSNFKASLIFTVFLSIFLGSSIRSETSQEIKEKLIQVQLEEQQKSARLRKIIKLIPSLYLGYKTLKFTGTLAAIGFVSTANTSNTINPEKIAIGSLIVGLVPPAMVSWVTYKLLSLVI